MTQTTSKQRRGKRTAAIEICHSNLHLAVLVRTPGQPASVETRTLPWRHEATSLHSEIGKAELAAALKRLAAEHKLHGTPVMLSLTGDFCVTRVVTGSTDRVRHELGELEKRSALYLSLGHGHKSIGGCMRHVDARHQHALLSVVNEKTLNVLVEVASKVSLEIEVIEPSLVSLCRFLGRAEAEDDRPVIIVKMNERSVEVGISQGGQLYLDYRPAGREAPEGVAELIGRHLARLQRYCDRYVKLSDAKLDRVLVCGEAEGVETVRKAFSRHGKIDVELLRPTAIGDDATFLHEAAGPELTAAVGACLLGDPAATSTISPNLMERLKAQLHEPLLPALAKTLWPVAAVLVVAMGAWGMVATQRNHCNALEKRLAQYEVQQQRTRIVRQTIIKDQVKIDHLRRISSGVNHAAWNEIATGIGNCLPNDVWLDTINVSPEGRLSLTGASYSEDGVFEFVRWLRASPLVEHVALGGTRSTGGRNGLATHFDIQCDIAGSIDQKGEANGEG